MSEEMYRELILDRYKQPQFKGRLEQADVTAGEVNPLCGDALSFDLKFGMDGRVERVAWMGKGCAISLASADLLAEKVVGLDTKEIAMLTNDDVLQLLGIELGPSRLKCATLSLLAVHKAAHDNSEG